MITMAGIREILAERRIFLYLPDRLTDDAEIYLDSMGFIWLFHMIQERFGLDVEPSEADIAELTSVRRIFEFAIMAEAMRIEDDRP